MQNTFYSTKRFIGRRSSNINEAENNMYDYQIDLNSEKVKLRCPRKSLDDFWEILKILKNHRKIMTF